MPIVRRLLVRQGTSFTDAITSFPLCCPSRASFLTGQYAHNHGVSGNFAPSGYYGLTHRDNTLPVWLQRAGYHTALIGKYLNGYGARNPREIPPGYSEWHGALDLSSYDYFNFTINENGTLHTWGDAGLRERPARPRPRRRAPGDRDTSGTSSGRWAPSSRRATSEPSGPATTPTT